jgi:hypothetical protein
LTFGYVAGRHAAGHAYESHGTTHSPGVDKVAQPSPRLATKRNRAPGAALWLLCLRR